MLFGKWHIKPYILSRILGYLKVRQNGIVNHEQ